MERYISRCRSCRACSRGQQAVVRLTAEAYNALIRLSNESGVPTKKIASEIIMQSLDHIEFTIEEAE